MTVPRFFTQLAVCAALAWAPAGRDTAAAPAAPAWDLVVYGGTAGGVITAVTAVPP
jgi:hypothetical protein